MLNNNPVFSYCRCSRVINLECPNYIKPATSSEGLKDNKVILVSIEDLNSAFDNARHLQDSDSLLSKAELQLEKGLNMDLSL